MWVSEGVLTAGPSYSCPNWLDENEGAGLTGATVDAVVETLRLKDTILGSATR
jgi:hypothetical protein